MNYFERLARRAMLRPAVAPGAAVVDPFERTDEWPLEEITRLTTSPPAAGELPSVAHSEPAVLGPAATTQTLLGERSETTLAPPTQRERAAPNAIAIAHIMPDPPANEDAERDPGPPSVQPPAGEAAALAHADAFLRNLGVRVPEAASEAITNLLTPPPDSSPARQHGEQREVRGSQVISPPASPFKALAASPTDPPSAAMDSLQMQQRSDRTTEAAPRARAPLATREIVLVGRAVAGREHGGQATAGVGSPHIGLGQL